MVGFLSVVCVCVPVHGGGACVCWIGLKGNYECMCVLDWIEWKL